MGQEGESGEEMMMEEWSERCNTVRWKRGTEARSTGSLCAHAQLFNHVHLFVTPRTVAHQTPLSMGFSWQEYWSGFSFLEAVKGKE